MSFLESSSFYRAKIRGINEQMLLIAHFFDLENQNRRPSPWLLKQATLKHL